MSFDSGPSSTQPTEGPVVPVATELFDPAQPASFPTQPVVSAGAPNPLVKPRSSARLLNTVLAVALVVAIGGVAFAVGRTTVPAAATGNRGNFPAGNFLGPGASLSPGASAAPGGFIGGGPGGLGGLAGGLTVSGTVQSVTSDTLTIETTSGQTVELGLDTDTTYHRQVDGAAADVATGSTVEVQLNVAGGLGRPTASADTSGPIGTASSVTVVP